eukprot:scaffold264194_cov49-Attheya_sp.AAC.1
MAPTSSAHKNTYATCRLYTTVYDTRAAGTKHCNGSVVAHDIVTASLSRDDVRKEVKIILPTLYHYPV